MNSEKVLWSDVREALFSVNPIFTEKVDRLKPNHHYPLYLLTLPYGDYLCDDINPLFGPLGCVLDKTIEFFVDVPELNLTIPKILVKAGEFIHLPCLLTGTSTKSLMPKGMLKATAGARTVFSLPYLTCHASFAKLEHDIGPLSKIPTSLYDHFFLFRDIARGIEAKDPWTLKLLYFSKTWLSSILTDKRWAEVKAYLFQKAWEESEYSHHQYFFDVSFSLMKEKENAKQNHYIYDTARHLFDIAVGAFPGLSPTTNAESLPLELIQTTLIKSYGLKKYIPTVLSPQYFSLEESKPVYYSLHYPMLRLFSPKTSSNKKSALKDIQALSRALNKFLKRISDEESIWQGTTFGETAQRLAFKFIHRSSRSGVAITYPADIINSDQRFLNTVSHSEDLIPSLDGNFFRGCVCLSKV